MKKEHNIKLSFNTNTITHSLTIFTGVRLGELMGLEWNDINFRDGFE